jgi:AraC-like DNA-binding protein
MKALGMITNMDPIYSNLSFAIMLLGIFSVFEITKTNQKLSLLKYYILARLIIVTAGSGLDYLGLIGYVIPYYKEVFKIVALLLTINLFFLIVRKKIPKLIVGIEIVYIVLFIIELFFGLKNPTVKEGMLQIKPTLFHQFFYGFYTLFGACSLLYNAIYLFRYKYKNLYELEIKKWIGAYILSNVIFFILNIFLFISLKKGTVGAYDNTMISVFIHRFLFIFFILYRPKFLDDDKFARPFNQILVENKGASFKNFEFLFYSNYYYLRQDANIDDFALKLNVTKKELSDFLKHEIDDNFTDLINKNRIAYIKELLKAKKYESFTIESLSEMSGFNNRRTMYYAFQKYNKMTPTEYIESIA